MDHSISTFLLAYQHEISKIGPFHQKANSKYLSDYIDVMLCRLYYLMRKWIGYITVQIGCMGIPLLSRRPHLYC